ncbi:MAG TPA: hypothetical protein VMM92_11000 [Thermoanaerobaculia bacterium]|nr:hypothetical protein [Thermoanaerobaculia bacterium]
MTANPTGAAENRAIACDLSALTAQGRAREQALLAWLRGAIEGAAETDRGWSFRLPAEPETLASLGELLAYERRCCPFLAFDLAVSARSQATLEIHGGPQAKAFIAATFGGDQVP